MTLPLGARLSGGGVREGCVAVQRVMSAAALPSAYFRPELRGHEDVRGPASCTQCIHIAEGWLLFHNFEVVVVDAILHPFMWSSLFCPCLSILSSTWDCRALSNWRQLAARFPKPSASFVQCWVSGTHGVQTDRCHPALTGLSSELPVDCLRVVTLTIINGSSRSSPLTSGDKISGSAGSCSSFLLLWLILPVPPKWCRWLIWFFLCYHSEMLAWCFCVRFGDGPKVPAGRTNSRQ